jgi:serine protein kinase
MSKLLNRIKKEAAAYRIEEYSLEEYLNICKGDPLAYASPAERLLAAIGEPVTIDTKTDPRLARIYSNRIINTYPSFKEFYGMEDTIEHIVSYFKHAAQGLEESKQVLYLLGPVGGGKSSIAEKLKSLMEVKPVYVIKGSPIYESPLGLFSKEEHGELLNSEYGIPTRALRTHASPWAIEKLKEFNGDMTKFEIQKIYPSRLNQACISRVEPGDENNQDISTLVGKVDIRMIDEYPQNHPYAYSYSGGLCKGNQGICEMVEIFKAPLKTLHPLLTATQEHCYNGTESISSLPFDGIIIAHSNETEWQQFRNNKANEAFLDRINLIKIPYCLRTDEEVQIYKKLLRDSTLFDAPCTPQTLDMLAQFCVLSRLKEPKNSTLYSKMRVYNGENIKDTDPKAKPLQEYRDDAGVAEGMDGVSTRFAFKVLSKVFNYDSEEVGANPIHLMYVLENEIMNEQYTKDKEEKLVSFIKGVLSDKFIEFIEKDIRAAFLESFSDLCQNIFDRYVWHADAWISDADFRDPDTNTMLDRDMLNEELGKIEKSAGIANPKDFRNEMVNYVLRYKASNEGKQPPWDSFEKMRIVIEKRALSSTEEILPVISFAPKKSEEDKRKHDDFVSRMSTKGYTARQTRLMVEWFMRVKKNG